MVKMVIFKDFPGSPVVKTPHSQCSGIGSIPGWGSKMPQEQPKLKKKKGTINLNYSQSDCTHSSTTRQIAAHEICYGSGD